LKETPLFIACKFGHDELVEKLLSLGADWKEKDFLGRSCKDIAKKYKRSRVLQVLSYWEHQILK